MSTIAVESPAGPLPETATSVFAALGLCEPLCRALADLKYEEPTPIQARTIPRMLAKADLIAQAQTGTGKTAAFALPILQDLDPALREPQALVLCPTRELAVQVAAAFVDFAKFTGARVLAVYGGEPIDRQLRPLRRGVQIVVGTPGRLLDHIRRGTLKLGTVRTVVLDEADEMLDMGFLDEIEAILKETPAERQTVFFSATMPPPIATLGKRYLRDAERIAIADGPASAPKIRQVFFEIGVRDRFEVLVRVLQHETPGSAIVFCRTRDDADAVGERLSERGLLAEALHGDLRQMQRDRVIGRFRGGEVGILTATDVAARGLDIDHVSHVINFELPVDPAVYVHRIGRTGRAGRSGCAMTLVGPRERRMLREVQRLNGLTGGTMERLPVPTLAAVVARRHEVFQGTLREALVGEPKGLTSYRGLAEGLMKDHPPADLLAAAFQMIMGPAPDEARDPLGAEPPFEDRGPSRWQRRQNGPGPGFDQGHRHAGPRSHDRGGSQGPDRGQQNFDRGPQGQAPEGAEPGRGGTRLFLNIGREDGVRPADLVGAIANEAGIPGRTIGPIELFGRFSFVEVPSGKAAQVMQALRNTLVRGRKVAPSLARPG